MKVKQSIYTTFSHYFEFRGLEQVSCLFCHSENRRLISKEDVFSVCECLDCGLVYVNPQPSDDDIQRFYDAMYETQPQTFPKERSSRYVEKHIARTLQQLMPQGGDLLEIGCGFGFLLERLANTRWRCSAIEPATLAVEHVRENLPFVNIKRGDIYSVEIAPESQDCVVAIAVLEHLKDPRRALQKMLSCLRPGGILVVQVPYVSPYLKMKKVLPFIPIYMEAPRHLIDFSPGTLRLFFEELGICDIGCDVARPYCTPDLALEVVTWAVKIPAILLHKLTYGRWIYPFAGAFVMWGRKSR